MINKTYFRKIKEEGDKILDKNNIFNPTLEIILSRRNKDGSIEYSLLYNDSEESLYEVNLFSKERIEFQSIPEWDFNIETYLFDDLENGFEIEYMTFSHHYGMWNSINIWKDEIDHTDGLQKYLKYCKDSGVTLEAMSMSQSFFINAPDVMDLYKEMNGKFEIIHEFSIGSRAVVLAKKTTTKDEFVTWRTTPTRKNGYDSGHYFTDFNNAYEDYVKRCSDAMQYHFMEIKSHVKNQGKERNRHER